MLGKGTARELKSIRVKLGLRLEDVAKMVGIHYETMRKYEIDASHMTIDIAEKLVNLYKIDPGIFFTNSCENTHIFNKVKQREEG